MTTEWEDLQIKLGNMAPRDIPKPLTDQEYDAKAAQNRERLEEQIQIAMDKKKSEDEIRDELEDEFADDDKIMEQLRYLQNFIQTHNMQAKKNC